MTALADKAGRLVEALDRAISEASHTVVTGIYELQGVLKVETEIMGRVHPILISPSVPRNSIVFALEGDRPAFAITELQTIRQARRTGAIEFSMSVEIDRDCLERFRTALGIAQQNLERELFCLTPEPIMPYTTPPPIYPLSDYPSRGMVYRADFGLDSLQHWPSRPAPPRHRSPRRAARRRHSRRLKRG